jgi:hypothetical protein
VLQDVIEQRGFASAEESGEHGDGKPGHSGGVPV